MRFDDRVAIVTGAGRGLGRSHALMLAARGAKVVVNDRGGSASGSGEDSAPSIEVVAEIDARFAGHAVGSTADVATADGAQSIVATALNAYGRLDIVINNAGIVERTDFADATLELLERQVAVHLGGSFNMTRAAWPYLVAQQYGRVVMTTSAAVFGIENQVSYASAKAGVIGLARCLAQVGANHAIKVNSIAPLAMTRMANATTQASKGASEPTASSSRRVDKPEMDLDPAWVSALVAVLAHESCPVTGEIYSAGGGKVARFFIAETLGYAGRGGISPEEIAANWDEINNEEGYDVPRDTDASLARFMSSD